MVAGAVLNPINSTILSVALVPIGVAFGEPPSATAWLISEWLPRVVEQPDDLEARTRLLEGAMHAGAALGKSMLALGHAMAQAVGGRYGIPHGAANAVCLPPALRFNAFDPAVLGGVWVS